ncbi:MAG: thiosulfate sulfurtransferase [Alphaproteobacteria bacterium]|nr:thiosulfate sulfurtransferase [Alphaproteobacteria bacterium]MCB9929457.1 thiosulfate sulfurtransferase [Alphaproteobacteria bacterium]
MSRTVTEVSAPDLKAWLKDGGEIAVLDAREEWTFGKRHLLLASCVPLSRLELMVDDLVPRRDTRVVWCDDGEGLAGTAARRMAALGYSQVSVLLGGVKGWEAAGFRVYSGVHVPSKAFAEVVEHDAGTPWVTAEQLKEMIDAKADIAIYDSRSYEEYNNNSIPTAISVPGAELVYRFTDLTPSEDTLVVVNCGGRTRSIIGAQSLINAGFRNKIVSMKDGTMAWHLAGFDVVNGATRRPPAVSEAGREAAFAGAARVRSLCDVREIDFATLEHWRSEAGTRTTYVIDVRTPEEYEAGHLAGVRLAAGGQLVQETDSHMAVWGARAVLVDDNGVRATMTASWLTQMGWADVAILKMDALDGAGGPLVKGRHEPKALGFDAASVAPISVAALRQALDAGTAVVVDFADSRSYGRGHIPGAWFSTRARLAEALARLPTAETLVFTSPEGALAGLAAADGVAAGARVLAGGTEAWVAAGLPLEQGHTHMADEADDVWLSARERGQNREEAMREYLAWEIDLVNQMATDDDHRFRVAVPR